MAFQVSPRQAVTLVIEAAAITIRDAATLAAASSVTAPKFSSAQ
jgi:hypothetical protein